MLTKTDQMFTRFLRAAVLLGEEKDSIYYNEAVICFFFLAIQCSISYIFLIFSINNISEREALFSLVQ